MRSDIPLPPIALRPRSTCSCACAKGDAADSFVCPRDICDIFFSEWLCSEWLRGWNNWASSRWEFLLYFMARLYVPARKQETNRCKSQGTLIFNRSASILIGMKPAHRCINIVSAKEKKLLLKSEGRRSGALATLAQKCLLATPFTLLASWVSLLKNIVIYIQCSVLRFF